EAGVVYLEGFTAVDKGNLRLSNVVTNDAAILMNLPGGGLDRLPPNDQAGAWRRHLMNGVLQSLCLTDGQVLSAPSSVLAEDGGDEPGEEEASEHGDGNDDEDSEEPRPFPEEPEESVSPGRRDREIRALVDKIHVNMAHLPKERMLVMLRAAGAKPEVLEYVKNRFSCETCERRQKQIPRRVAAFPKTYAFNKIVGGDVFYLPWQGRSVPFLNLICHGSHWQSVTMIRPLHGGPPSGGTPLAQEVAKVMNEAWFKPYGVPEVMLTDGGKEFAGECERLLEQHNIFHHVCDAESPWQNSRAERHGGIVKDRARREIEEGAGV
ncbi:SRR1, partial [Symbiodinium sp. CCMP2456]